MLTFKALGRYGRLGNQMFQIASTIGLATRNGHDYSFPKWINYDHKERFGSSEDCDIYKFFDYGLPEYKGQNCDDVFIHWGYWPVSFSRGNYNLSGHMQSEKYFDHCSDLIRQVFKMKDEYEQNDYCAVHIRLGDYDDNYHPRLKMDYYSKAMAEFPTGTKFLIFSDDICTCKQMFGNGVDYKEGGGYMDDFKYMKSCESFIIGNSTFSWWAAWLGNADSKKVVAPSLWFGKVAGLDAKDIYAKDWTVI